MHRRSLLAGLGAAAVGGLAGCQAPGTGEGGRPGELVNPSFEAGYRGWLAGRDLPTDPNTGRPVASGTRIASDPVAAGERSLELSIDGLQDDGTLWVQQTVDLTGADALSVAVHSPEESFNTITKVAAYAGPRPARGHLREGDFDTTAPVEDHAGWRVYEYDVNADGPGVVAVGVSVVWETRVTRYLDDVRLE